MLLLGDHNSISGREFLKYTGADYHFSEYEMYLRKSVKLDSGVNNVVLRKASNSEAREIARLDSVCFDEEFKEENILIPEEEEKSGFVICFAEADNRTIGKVNLEMSGTVRGIYGLGVLPEYRGKGYGRGILARAIEKLQESGSEEVMLQVEAKNENALNLYKSCGFEITSTMDYYRMVKK